MLFGVLALFVFIVKLYIYEAESKKKIIDSPMSFTVMISNLPKGITDGELKNVIEEKFSEHLYRDFVADYETGDNSVQVVDLTFAYKIDEFVKDFRKYEKVKRKILRRGWKCCRGSDEELEKEKNDLQMKIKEFCLSKKEFKKNGIAFVTFRKVSQKSRVVDYFRFSFCQKMRAGFRQACCLRDDGDFNERLENGRIRIKSAPHPTDIIWGNLSIGFYERVVRSFVSTLVGLVFSIICVLLIYLFQVGKVSSTEKSTSESKIDKFIFSTLIWLFNHMISACFNFLASFERHSSHTEETISLMKKRYYCKTANTVISFLVILGFDISKKRFESCEAHFPGALTSWLITEAILTPLFMFINRVYFMKLFYRYLIRNNKILVEQKEANEIFTNPKFRIEENLERCLTILAVVLIFSPLCPLALILSLFPMFTFYCSNKFLLLRRYSRSNQLSKKIYVQMMSTFSTIIPIYLVNLI